MSDCQRLALTLQAATQSDAQRIATIRYQSCAAAMLWLPVVHTPDQDLWFFLSCALPLQQVNVVSCAGEMLLEQAQACNDTLRLLTFEQNHVALGFTLPSGLTVFTMK